MRPRPVQDMAPPDWKLPLIAIEPKGPRQASRP